jgi:hypothetical protein
MRNRWYRCYSFDFQTELCKKTYPIMDLYRQRLDSATTVLKIQSSLVCHSVLTGVSNGHCLQVWGQAVHRAPPPWSWTILRVLYLRNSRVGLTTVIARVCCSHSVRATARLSITSLKLLCKHTPFTLYTSSTLYITSILISREQLQEGVSLAHMLFV